MAQLGNKAVILAALLCIIVQARAQQDGTAPILVPGEDIECGVFREYLTARCCSVNSKPRNSTLSTCTHLRKHFRTQRCCRANQSSIPFPSNVSGYISYTVPNTRRSGDKDGDWDKMRWPYFFALPVVFFGGFTPPNRGHLFSSSVFKYRVGGPTYVPIESYPWNWEARIVNSSGYIFSLGLGIESQHPLYRYFRMTGFFTSYGSVNAFHEAASSMSSAGPFQYDANRIIKALFPDHILHGEADWESHMYIELHQRVGFGAGPLWSWSAVDMKHGTLLTGIFGNIGTTGVERGEHPAWLFRVQVVYDVKIITSVEDLIGFDQNYPKEGEHWDFDPTKVRPSVSLVEHLHMKTVDTPTPPVLKATALFSYMRHAVVYHDTSHPHGFMDLIGLQEMSLDPASNQLFINATQLGSALNLSPVNWTYLGDNGPMNYTAYEFTGRWSLSGYLWSYNLTGMTVALETPGDLNGARVFVWKDGPEVMTPHWWRKHVNPLWRPFDDDWKEYQNGTLCHLVAKILPPGRYGSLDWVDESGLWGESPHSNVSNSSNNSNSE